MSRAGHAQAFPERPLRFVVPYAPGGSTDTSSRIIAERLSVLFGQQVIVDNKPGGGTIIGTEVVAKAKPDGHTILLTPGALVVNAAFGITLPYDSFKDLAPVARFVDIPLLLAANNEAPFKSVAELLAWPKSGDRTIAYASAGIGSVPHLWGEYLKARTGLPLAHIGYQGCAEALRDAMAAPVPLFDVDANGAPVAGKLPGLAVAMSARSPLPRRTDGGRGGPRRHGGRRPFGISTPAHRPLSSVGMPW